MKTRLSACVLLPAFLASTMVSVMAGRVAFIEDDYARARDEAIKRKVPLFVEVWAPW